MKRYELFVLIFALASVSATSAQDIPNTCPNTVINRAGCNGLPFYPEITWSHLIDGQYTRIINFLWIESRSEGPKAIGAYRVPGVYDRTFKIGGYGCVNNEVLTEEIPVHKVSGYDEDLIFAPINSAAKTIPAISVGDILTDYTLNPQDTLIAVSYTFDGVQELSFLLCDIPNYPAWCRVISGRQGEAGFSNGIIFTKDRKVVGRGAGLGWTYCERTSMRIQLFSDPQLQILLANAVPVEDEVPLPSLEVSLYPNPTSSSTTLEFSSDHMQHVRIAVYDILGREVNVLHEGVLTLGKHVFRFLAEEVPSGVYLVSINAEMASRTMKLIVTR